MTMIFSFILLLYIIDKKEEEGMEIKKVFFLEFIKKKEKRILYRTSV